MAISKGLDPATVERGLTQWLSAHHAGARATHVSIPPGSGGSHECVIFTAGWDEGSGEQHERLVARVVPSGPGLFPHYDIEREFRLLKALTEHAEIPVPDVRWLERDTSFIGAPFMTMPFINGRTLPDDPPFTATGWLLELTADQQATVYDNALRTIATLHTIDPDTLGLEFLDEQVSESPLASHLTWLREFYDWAAEGESHPAIEAALAWATEHQPPSSRRALIWGDARLANVIINDNLSVAAAVDWELARIGAPEFDLAWWLFMNRHHTDGFGLPRPAGWPDDAETTRRYEELSGHPVENLHFYLVLAGVQLSTLMVRVARLMIAAGIVPPDSTMGHNNPAVQMLADLLDLPRPDARDTATFTGVFAERDAPER
ncbi:MAG: phosphotransferase family protein [Solirubrobacteraceae bacterium]